jgi:hypothetical protein
MHRRDFAWGEKNGMVIGRVENLRVDGDSLIGTPVFDMEDDFAAKIAHKWENDFLRMCSPGIEPIETSSAPEHLLPGQVRETVTKSKLVELSIVDIGSNDDALQLYSGGTVLNLSAGAASDLLPLLNTEPEAKPAPADHTDNKKITLSMEKILLALGLAATASESDALAAITKLQTTAARVETLELASITTAVDAAIAARKITADKRDKFIALGKDAGIEHLGTALDAMAPAVKPMNLINPGSTATGGAATKAYDQMSEQELLTLSKENPDEFKRLFKAEFGVEYEG